PFFANSSVCVLVCVSEPWYRSFLIDLGRFNVHMCNTEDHTHLNQTRFTRFKGTTARSEALLIDGFIHCDNIKKISTKPILNINNPYSFSSNSNLPEVILDGNEFESEERLNRAAIALGSGINYVLITDTRFIKSQTTNKKITQINFESSEKVAEPGGANQIMGN
ncbi:MAG: hypothetical protein EZS28_049895, partial [Streblomastix strix]